MVKKLLKPYFWITTSKLEVLANTTGGHQGGEGFINCKDGLPGMGKFPNNILIF